MANCSTCPSNGTCSKDKESCGIVNNPLNHIKNVIGIMSVREELENQLLLLYLQKI